MQQTRKNVFWINMKKAVIVFSGGVDSVCAVSFLKSKYELYGIVFVITSIRLLRIWVSNIRVFVKSKQNNVFSWL